MKIKFNKFRVGQSYPKYFFKSMQKHYDIFVFYVII